MATNYFIPKRTDDKLDTNSYYNTTGYWTSNSEYFYKNCAAGVWQCTYYAMARSCEIARQAIDRRWNTTNPIFPGRDGWGDAGNWADQTGWTTGSTPKLGAIVVWKDSSAGHVGIVEHVYANGNVDISQANLTISGSKTKFYLDSNTLPTSEFYVNKGLTFYKYIYNPYASLLDVEKDRNRSVAQINATVATVRIREDHSTSSNVLGRCNISIYYDVQDTYNDGTYTWYEISGGYGWVAGVSEIVYHQAGIIIDRALSLYKNGTTYGAAFGKEATLGSTVEFAQGMQLKSTNSEGISVSKNASDVIGITMKKLTQSEYDALTAKDNTVMYIIIG